jgi:hypothetical protein
MANFAPNTPDKTGTWETRWLRPDDVALLRFTGYMSLERLNTALDELGRLLDGAGGDLIIYIVADESGVEEIEDSLGTAAALHPAYFHPRGGKLYIVGSTGELYAINEALGSFRQGSIRLTETLPEALADIDERRTAYFAKLGKVYQPN